jgi:uncharacterized protein YdeI (YjbR/CyaY-like superfamily)
VLIVVINALSHLFQEAINQFTAVIVSDNTNQMIQVETDRQETIELQDIQETIELQDIQETIELQEILEIILDQVEEKAINS